MQRFPSFAIALWVAAPALAYAAGGPGQSLIESAKEGDGRAFSALLQHGSDVNAAEPDGTTPLHWAAHNGDLTMVNALIRAKANINAKNRYGIAPLWLAATNGHADAVEALLRAGADPQTTRADSGETVLMVAAMAGHAPVLQRLLAYGANPNAADSIRKQTALMWAAAEAHLPAAKVLVEAGGNLEARSSTGMTPLMFAIRGGSIETTVGLLDLGADLKAKAPDGTTSLGLAILNAHWNLAEKLVDRGADVNEMDPRGAPLHLVAFIRRADNRGLSSFLPRRDYNSPESLQLAKALLAHGARVNERISYKNPNFNPDHMAISYFAATNYQGATALYVAAKSCDIEFVRFLVANGADPKIDTVQGVTPLLTASGIGYAIGESSGTPEEALETVKYLASLGLDVRATADKLGGGGFGPGGGWNGSGALHGAVIRGATELVKWLIDQGVPLDRPNKSGETPLDLARGSSLGVTYHVQPELAELIEKEMTKRGLTFKEHQYINAEGKTTDKKDKK
jgi:ankyrin repeat protein